MNENQLTIVKEYEFDDPLIQKIDSPIDKSKRDCHKNYFHTFEHICEYNLNFTNLGNNEIVNFTNADKSMGLYELNKKSTIARGNGFRFNQINKLTIKIYNNLSNKNICYYLKHRIPMCHSKILPKISHNREYIQIQCNDRRNFSFCMSSMVFIYQSAMLILYNYPHSNIYKVILVQIHFCQFLKNGNRYRVAIFSVDLVFNGLSNNISHFVVTQIFIISTCLRCVDTTDFVNFLENGNRYRIEFFSVN